MKKFIIQSKYFFLLAAFIFSSSFAEALELPADFKLRSSLHGLSTFSDTGTATTTSNDSVGELRLNLLGSLNAIDIVFSPRFFYTFKKESLAPPDEGGDAELREFFARGHIGGSRLVVGKRHVGWGTGLMHNPTNRFARDNKRSLRSEAYGNWSIELSGAPNELTELVLLTGYVALEDDNYLSRDPFVVARIDRYADAVGRPDYSLVMGAGAGLMPYLGGYLQYSVGESITFAAEGALSNGYADNPPTPADALEQNDDSELLSEISLTGRYGFTNGGEIALEYFENGYNLNAAEEAALLALPGTSSLYSGQSTGSASALPAERYLNLQLITPELFGRRNLGLFAQHIEALGQHHRYTRAELRFSPSSNFEIFAGAAVAGGRGDSVWEKALGRSVYIAFEFFI